jgi:hypothetical protein
MEPCEDGEKNEHGQVRWGVRQAATLTPALKNGSSGRPIVDCEVYEYLEVMP